MNVVANSPASGSGGSESSLCGELIVQNGRLKGKRRPLGRPLTLLGQSPGSDVRLNIEGVRPLHCAILETEQGYVLRDLDGGGGTFVNGQKVKSQLLNHGDLIVVGPFQFLLDLPEHARTRPERISMDTLRAERDALRIQAAAVAAQQAGLTEEEIRLEQRRVALQRQEEQLAAHLDERQKRVEEMQEQARQELAAFQADRTAEQKRLADEQANLGRALDEADTARKQLQAERNRVLELRKRMTRRWRRHWSAKQAEIQKLAQQLDDQQQGIQIEVEQFQRERAGHIEQRLRFNGEMEVGRRQLQEERQELALAQQKWEECLNDEHQAQARRLRDLDERIAALAQGEKALAEQQQHWQQLQCALELDVQGLENRLVNQRLKLQEQERQVAQLQATQNGFAKTRSVSVPASSVTDSPGRAPADSSVAFVTVESASWPAELKYLAGMVADQRAHLLEQWERLLHVQEAWDKERESLLAGTDEAARHLSEREKQLDERADQIVVQERDLEARLVQLQQRQESLAQLRCSLEGWQARFKVQTAEWEAKHAEMLAAMHLREQAAAGHVNRWQEVHRRRTIRLRRDLAGLAEARERCEEMRRQYCALWKVCEQQQHTLLEEQKALDRQTLSLERFRMECLGQVSNQPAAEKRLERLRRKIEALDADTERHLGRERELLLAETNRLDERARAVQERENELNLHQEELATQLTEFENQQMAGTEVETRRQIDCQRLISQHEHDERQIHELREEIERVARLLLDEADGGTPSANQAA
jgi:pSer/pThr/pTyr-binding forkhead associated (FHA) protein